MRFSFFFFVLRLSVYFLYTLLLLFFAGLSIKINIYLDHPHPKENLPRSGPV